MTMELEDSASFDGSIADTSTETVTVEARRAEYFQVLVDDGTTGGTPANYGLVVEQYSAAVDDWMQVDSVSSTQANHPQVLTNLNVDARGQQVRVKLTNSSGASANYRISLTAFRSMG